jgi:hypothetical protein
MSLGSGLAAVGGAIGDAALSTGGGSIGKDISAFMQKRGDRKKKRKRDSDSSSGGSSGSNPQGSGVDPSLTSYHSGGKVRKTGPANLRKGETVLTKGQMKKMRSGRGKRRGGKSR